MTKSYVVYYRVSTKKQGDSGLGLDAQKRDISIYFANYAETGNLLKEFTEIESGSKNSRPQLSEAIAFAKKHKATLLVAKLDRLSRKVSYIANLLEDKKLKLVVACMPNADKSMLQIYAWVAEQERTFISQRTKAALAEAKKRGVKLGNHALSAKEQQALITRKKEVAVARAEEYRATFEMFIKQGCKTCYGLSKCLNTAKIKTPKNGTWQATTVQRMLDKLNINFESKAA